MENFRIIQVRYYQETNTNAPRVGLTESRGNTLRAITERKTIYFNWGSFTLDNAIGYLQSIGINVVGSGSFKGDFYILSDSWADENGFISITGKISK